MTMAPYPNPLDSMEHLAGGFPVKIFEQELQFVGLIQETDHGS